MNCKLAISLAFILVLNKIEAQFSSVEVYNTRTIGMAEITTITDDLNSLFGNNAGLVFIEGIGVSAGILNRFEVKDLYGLNVGLASKAGKIGSLGLSFKKFGFDQYGEYQISFNYAKKLSKNISLGLRFNSYTLHIAEYGNKFTANADISAMYKISNHTTLGFNLINPYPVLFTDENRLPTIIQFGFKYKISDQLEVASEIEKHIDHELLLKIGLDYKIMKKFELYGGYRNDLNKFADYSFGFGYDINNILHVDAAIQYDLTLGVSPSITVIYNRKH